MAQPTRCSDKAVRIHTRIANESTPNLPEILRSFTTSTIYSRITPETNLGLRNALRARTIPTIAMRYDIIALDWNSNLRLHQLLVNIRGQITNVNDNITFRYTTPSLHSSSLGSPSLLPNISTLSVAPSMVSVAQSIHYYGSPSGQAVVHMIDNAMDLTQDFNVFQPPRAPSPFDTIMSDPDPDPALVLQHRSQLQKNIDKAERRFILTPPHTPGKYNRFQTRIVDELGTVVPVFYCITFSSRALTIIIGIAHMHGFVLMAQELAETMAAFNRLPSDSAMLVSLCFERVVLAHNTKLVADLDNGQTLRTLPIQSGKIEDG